MPIDELLPTQAVHPLRSSNAIAVGAADDMIQFFVERIMQCRSSRTECYEAIQSFLCLHPARDIQFGYLYNRIQLAKLLVVGCGNAELEPSLGRKDLALQSSVNLHDWNRKKWIDFIENLKSVVLLLFRMDATVELASEEDADDLEDDTHVNCCNRTQKMLHEVFDLLILSAAAAPIRRDLDATVVADRVTTSIFEIDENRLIEFSTFMDNDVDAHLQIHFNSIRHVEAGKLSITTDEKFIELMRALASQHLQEKMESMVLLLNLEVYGSKAPKLVELNYLPRCWPSSYMNKTKSNLSCITNALRLHRETLQNNIQDPLDNIGPNLNRRAPQSNFSEEFDNDEVDKADTPHLTELCSPRTKRSRVVEHQKDSLHPPDEGLFDRNGNVTERRKFTAEEKDALLKGVEEFGTGKWKLIKNHYKEIFKNRTSVQIKDCWRTMLAKKEIDQST